MSLGRKILLVVGIVLAVIILVPVIRHYQLRWQLHSTIAQLKAKGVPMDLAQVLPPKLSPEVNGTEAFLRADKAFNEAARGGKNFFWTNYVGGMAPVAPGKAMIGSQQPEIRNSEGTFSWNEVAEVVRDNDKSIAPLTQLIDKPNFDFGFDYGKGFTDFNFNQLYLAQSKRAAQRLATAAMVDLHDGDTVSAVKNIRAMLALSKAVAGERLLISELVGMAIAGMASGPTWEVLQSPNVTDEQLAQLQQDWASLDFISDEANAVAMEGVMDQITAEQWRKSNAQFQKYLRASDEVNGLKHQETAFEKMRDYSTGFVWRNWWSYPDEMKALEGYEIINETRRNIETNYALQVVRTEQNEKIFKLFGAQTNDSFSPNVREIFSANVPTLASALRRVELYEATKQVVVTAIALKRYQIKHGNYPVNLDVLVPEFLASVPLDPVDGQPLRYKLNGSGDFILYSIGENGIDDGGNPSLEKGVRSSNYYWQNNHALDWVWPQPATSEEVQKYYSELSKKSQN